MKRFEPKCLLALVVVVGSLAIASVRIAAEAPGLPSAGAARPQIFAAHNDRRIPRFVLIDQPIPVHFSSGQAYKGADGTVQGTTTTQASMGCVGYSSCC